MSAATFTDEEIEAIKAKARAEALAGNLTPAAPAPIAPPEPVVTLQVDTTKITIGDQESLLRFGAALNKTDEESLLIQADVIAMLHRLVVGGVKHLPLSDMPMVMRQVTKALNKLGDPQGN